MSSLAKLGEPRTLWISFLATALMTVAFQIVARSFNLPLLDALSDPPLTRSTIETMTSTQRTLHAWMTGTLDVAYPLAYGAWFIGSAYCFFPRKAHLLAVPTLVLIGADLSEGVVQVLALTGIADWVDAKAILTPLKVALFVLGLVVTLCGWVRWSFARLSSGAD